MATTLNALTLLCRLGGVLQEDVTGVSRRLDKTMAESFVNGNQPGQANHLWLRENILLAMDANEDLDLYNFTGLDIGCGAGEDLFGKPVTYQSVVGFLIENLGPGTLKIGGNGTAQAWYFPFDDVNTNKVVVLPGGFALFGTKTGSPDGGYPVSVGIYQFRLGAVSDSLSYNLYMAGID